MRNKDADDDSLRKAGELMSKTRQKDVWGEENKSYAGNVYKLLYDFVFWLFMQDFFGQVGYIKSNMKQISDPLWKREDGASYNTVYIRFIFVNYFICRKILATKRFWTYPPVLMQRKEDSYSNIKPLQVLKAS